MVITPVLKTERLLLRPFALEDAPAMYRWTSSLKCTEFLFWRPNRSLEDATRILSRWVNKPRNYAWAIDLSGTAIGEINVIKNLPNQGFEIGYILRDDQWGQGYMSEAFTAVLSFLWNQGYRYGSLPRLMREESPVPPPSREIRIPTHRDGSGPLHRQDRPEGGCGSIPFGRERVR
jgi:RimJ/RimL family protein N-acetyltransferase